MKILYFLLVLLFGSAAAAAGDNRPVAKEAFREGTRQYDLGDYSKALELFKKAYLNYEEPAILYNLGQCQRMLGEKQEAVKLYRSYLRKVPDAPNRADVERVISRLESEIEHERATKMTPPSGTMNPNEKQPQLPADHSLATQAPAASALAVTREHAPIYRKWWLWTTIGVAVAAGVSVGLGVGLSRPQKFEPTVDGFGPGTRSTALETN